MAKKILFGVLFLFLIGFVAAGGSYDDFSYKEKFSSTKYYPDENLVLSHTTYIDYDNEYKHSTYDYRNGYTYRSTPEYLEDHYYDRVVRTEYSNHRVVNHRNKDYYYEYVPHLRNYKVRECYNRAPSDKLFYIKC